MIDTDVEAAHLKRLAHAVRTMDQRTRDIFLMHRIDDLDYPALPVRLRIGVDAVERRVAAAMTALRDATKGYPSQRLGLAQRCWNCGWAAKACRAERA